MNPDIVKLVLAIGFLILSLGVHEAAHAYVAHLCGDDTARAQGRLTLNPIAHIDPFMSILLPAVLYLTSGFIFGGARPVPVNYYNLRHPLRDMALVAIAGPASNFVQAILYMLVYKTLVDVVGMDRYALAPAVIGQAVIFNLVLTIFNLIPVPPLDGSRVMAYVLPTGVRETYVGLERYGMLIVFALLFSGVLSRILQATIEPLHNAVDFLSGGPW